MDKHIIKVLYCLLYFHKIRKQCRILRHENVCESCPVSITNLPYTCGSKDWVSIITEQDIASVNNLLEQLYKDLHSEFNGFAAKHGIKNETK